MHWIAFSRFNPIPTRSIRAWVELGSVSSFECLDAPAALPVEKTAGASRHPRLEAGKTLDNNDLNQVGVQRF